MFASELDDLVLEAVHLLCVEAGSAGAGGPQLEAVLEEMPKWSLVQEILQVLCP